MQHKSSNSENYLSKTHVIKIHAIYIIFVCDETYLIMKNINFAKEIIVEKTKHLLSLFL